MGSKLNGSGVYEMTRQEIEGEADIEAQAIGMRDYQEAFQKLDDGELEGTAAASIFESYRFAMA